MSAVQDRDSARAGASDGRGPAGRRRAGRGARWDAATVNSVGDQVSAAVSARLDAAHVVISVLVSDGRREPLAGGDAAARVAIIVSGAGRLIPTLLGPRAVRDRAAVYVADLKAPGRGDRVRAAALPLLTEVGAFGCLAVWWAGPREGDRRGTRVSAEHGRRRRAGPWSGPGSGRPERRGARAGRGALAEAHQAARRGPDPRGGWRGGGRSRPRGRRWRRRAMPRCRQARTACMAEVDQHGRLRGGGSASSSRTCRWTIPAAATECRPDRPPGGSSGRAALSGEQRHPGLHTPAVVAHGSSWLAWPSGRGRGTRWRDRPDVEASSAV